MIEILLAAHNGEKYISSQIDSLLCQTFSDFHITIRDDNSNDNTIKIIDSYIKKFPDKITLINDNKICNSSCLNFLQLMKTCQSEYYAFCDQDDIWKKDKLYLEYNKMQEIELLNGHETPVLIHTDLSVTDENMIIKHKSFIKYKRLSKLSNIKRLLVENNVTGCTCLFNKSLRDIAINMPTKIKVHDWWIALIASCFGEIGFVNKSLVLYRQHENNLIGASNRAKRSSDIKSSIDYSYFQAKKFLLTFSEEMSVIKFKAVAQYSCFPIKNKLYRIKYIICKGYRKNRLIKLLGQIIFC